MAEGRSRQLWDHTSSLLAMIANGLLRSRGKSAFQPRQFNPHLEKIKNDVSTGAKEAFAIMKEVFVGSHLK